MKPTPYTAYKTSGVKWLGDVPAHWEIQRGKALFQPVDVRSQTGNEELLTVSAERGIVPRNSANVTMFKAESYVGYKLCWPGDLVINSLWAWAHGLGVSRYHGIVSSAYGVYRLLPKFKNYASFIHRMVRSIPFQWELQVRSKGIWISRLQLTDESFLGASFPLPPLPEQSAIVRYLDHVDERISRYISAKERLINLLEEQRQAVIQRAVTRGLDPNVRLKPSGAEWLGDVPAHWTVRRIKQCAHTISKGTTPSTEGRQILEFGHVRFIKAENITAGGIVDRPLCYIDSDTNDLLRRSQLQEGDILFVIAGATLGKIAVVHRELLPANTNQAVAFIRPHKQIVPNYLAFWLQSLHVKELIWLNAVQSAQPNLSMADLGNFLVPLSTHSEQTAIVKDLDKATADIDAAITRARREIELLKEYRTRLIADVVTGKLDVREAAFKLPEVPDELNRSDTVDDVTHKKIVDDHAH